MNSPRSLPPASATVRGLPRGEVIGRYGTYVDAQKAVDHGARGHQAEDLGGSAGAAGTGGRAKRDGAGTAQCTALFEFCVRVSVPKHLRTLKIF